MNRLSFVVSLLLIVGLVNLASAQRPGGAGAAGILMIEAVQKELNITEDQKTKLREALAGQRANFQDFQSLSREERQKKIEEMAKKTDESLKGILDAKQSERLGQLRIQREGGAALVRADVATTLSLTPEQKDQIAKIQTESAPTAGANFRDLSEEERTKAFAEMREKREKASASMLAVLTADQKAAFEKMQGTKFEFPAAPAGGRPRNNN